MKISFTIIFLLLSLQFPVSNAEQISVDPVEPIDKVVAIVNDDVILASQLQERTRMIYQQARQQGKSAPPPQIVVPQVLERLILESLQLQLAERAGVKISSEELNAALASIARQNKIPLEKLKSTIEAEGSTFSAFRKNVENEMVLQRIQQAAVNKRIKITEQDITNFLQSEEGKLALSEEFHLAHIVINYSADNEGDKEKSVTLAENILLRLNQGESFSDLARQYSSSADHINGGDLGWRSYKDLPSLYSQIATQLKDGEISKILTTSDAVYIVKLLEKRSANQQHVQQTHVRHILIKPSAIRNDEEAATLLKKIREQVLNGQDFGELAKNYSEDYSSALKGGDIGWTIPGQLVPQFQEVMDNTSIDTISYPFQSQYGWHILQVLGRQQKDMSEEIIRQSVKNLLMQRQFEVELPLWLQELRAEAYVVIKDPTLQSHTINAK